MVLQLVLLYFVSRLTSVAAVAVAFVDVGLWAVVVSGERWDQKLLAVR